MNNYSVLFYIGECLGETKRYRSFNIAYHLKESNISYTINNKIDDIINKISYDNIVLVRCLFNEDVKKLIDYSRALNSKIICDFDDLIFEEKYIPYIDGMRFRSPENRHRFIKAFPLYKKVIESSDIFISPTDYLCGESNKISYTIKNSLGPEALSISKSVFKNRSYDKESIAIGYYSGSLTHQADFYSCFEAIYNILRDKDNIVLRILGGFNVSEFPLLEEMIHKNKVKMVNFLPYEKMIQDYINTDIAIAPLEVGNPFCESKSELKFFEAAACGVPVVASSTYPFKSAIKEGITGFTADKTQDWYDKLNILISDENVRRSIGKNSRDYVIKEYNYKKIGKDFLDIINGRGICSNTISEPNKYSIGFFIDKLDINNPVHETFICLCYYLEKIGCKITIYTSSNQSNSEELLSSIRSHSKYYLCSDIVLNEHIKKHDSYVFTDVNNIKDIDSANKCILVTDMLHEEYKTLDNGINKIYLTKHILHMDDTNIIKLDNMEKIECNDYIDVPVDKNIYYPEKRSRYIKSLCIFVEKNKILKFKDKIEELCRVIQNKDPYIKINAFYNTYSVKDIRHNFSNSDLGIYFNDSELNIRSFHMMACGLPILNILGRGIEDCDPAYVCNFKMNNIADTIIDILSDDNYETLLKRRSKVVEYIKENNNPIRIANNFLRLLKGAAQ